MSASRSDWIPISAPAFLGNERSYVLDCIESTWISSIGKYISAFEEAFAEACGVRHAVACANGTVALHAALLAVGVSPGDRVLVPSLTYVASVNAIRYCGAEPVFVDSDLETWNLDPQDLAIKAGRGGGFVMPVHLYGTPCPMEAVGAISRAHRLQVVEDAAEAVGARVGERSVGTLGDLGVFSFFGNKILTTGEGGMIVTGDDALAQRARMIKGQGQDPARRYWFPIIGYNYRMTNIEAAIGLAQLERLAEHIERRDEIDRWYRSRLAGLSGARPQRRDPGHRAVDWLTSVVLDVRDAAHRDRVMEYLRRAGIETRPFFFPCHILPPYQPWRAAADCPRAEWLAARGVSLPTWVGLSESAVDRIVNELGSALADPATRGE